MNVESMLPFHEVLVIEPPVYRDDRGHFREIFRADTMRKRGLEIEITQLNHSHSRRGVLRGLHFQHPDGQGKLVAVTSGRVFDVAVDIRVGSPTFGRWSGLELSAIGGEQLYLPPGFAHGFLVLSDSADVVYGCTSPYRPESEHVLLWDDPEVGVSWPFARQGEDGAALATPLVSEKDRRGCSLSDLGSDGLLPSHAP